MKKILIGCYVLVLCSIVVYYVSKMAYSKEDSIKVGQTWKYSIGTDNPFEKGFITYKEVIDVKGNYVLYINENKDTVSETKSWFVVCGEILK